MVFIYIGNREKKIFTSLPVFSETSKECGYGSILYYLQLNTAY